MKVDFNKLTEDLKAANQAAVGAVKESDDRGSANRDCVFLMVPRARETKVLEAIRSAGLYCRRKTHWFSPGYMINPTTGGQGNKRSKGVGVMYQYLKAAGYDVITYCQMD